MTDNSETRRFRTEEQLRQTLSMLCNFVWTGKTRPCEHMWSIPADPERDFDFILSDAIDELVERRKEAQGDPAPAPPAQEE